MRKLITLTILSILTLGAFARAASYTAAVYDNDGNFLDVMTVEISNTTDAVTVVVQGTEFNGSTSYAHPVIDNNNMLLFKAIPPTQKYMIVDDKTFSLRFSDTMPDNANDFEYALSFDPKDWSNLRTVLN